MGNHSTVGVYGNQTFQINIVSENDLENHIKYNVIMRPGRLLFVDGKYHSGGCLKKEFLDKQVEKWEKEIANMNIDLSRKSDKYW